MRFRSGAESNQRPFQILRSIVDVLGRLGHMSVSLLDVDLRKREIAIEFRIGRRFENFKKGNRFENWTPI